MFFRYLLEVFLTFPEKRSLFYMKCIQFNAKVNVEIKTKPLTAENNVTINISSNTFFLLTLLC